MLNFMRRNANSWVMILLFAIIIFVFAINFGPWAGGRLSQGAPFAALVNNEPISMAEFRAFYSSQFARIKQFRPDYDQSQAEKDGLKQMVMEQLVARELLTQLGGKHGLSIGPKLLAEEIKERVFGKEADFNKEEYIRRVNTFFQATVSQFEEQVSKELIAEQMANILGTVVNVSDDEAKMAFKDKNTKIALEFVKVDPSYFKSIKPLTSDEIAKYQKDNEAKINDYYNEHISDYIKEEQIHASQILIKVPKDASDAEKATLKEKAEKILARVRDNEDFAKVAEAESDDISSKANGGDLGYFTPGTKIEEFSKAAFALKPGEISNLVISPLGFHIIKVFDIKPKTEMTLQDASKEIAELLIHKEQQQQKAKELANLALLQFKKNVPLLNIKIHDLVNAKTINKTPNAPVADETELFSRSSLYAHKIGRLDNISEEAFKLTMENPTAPNVIEANGDFFAIRLKSRQDADMAKFEEEKESIKMSLLFPRKRALIQQFLAHLKEGAKIKYNEALISTQEVNL